MNTLVVIPTQLEMDAFLEECADRGFRREPAEIGRLPVVRFSQVGLTVAAGGFGKAQFALQTQHLIDGLPGWNVVVCAGAAGALVDDLAAGDVIVATETVEHDFRRSSTDSPPRFPGDEATLKTLRPLQRRERPFAFHFGSIASGDEDVFALQRRQAIAEATGALATAWEGAGAARACQFSSLPFVELRGITDHADDDFGAHLKENLPRAMRNVAAVIIEWAAELRTRRLLEQGRVSQIGTEVTYRTERMTP